MSVFRRGMATIALLGVSVGGQAQQPDPLTQFEVRGMCMTKAP
jgi:hypothetical protein